MLNCLEKLIKIMNSSCIEGIVTSTNEEFLTFELNNTVTVYIVHLAATKVEELVFPDVNDRVKLYNTHRSDLSSIILCEKSRMIVENKKCKPELECNFLLNLLRMHELGIKDVKKIMQTSFKMKETIGKFLVSVNRVISNLIQEYLSCNTISETMIEENTYNGQFCDNHLLQEFSILTVSDCRYVDPITKQNKKIPYWSFGSHSKKQSGELLIGFLYICPVDGVLVLSDSRHKILLILLGSTNNKRLRALINTVVVLQNYTVFTEIFNEPVGNSECILCDKYDISSLKEFCKERNCRKHIFEQLPAEMNFTNKIKFLLLNQTPVCLSKENKRHCWLQVSVLETNVTNFHNSIYLCVYFQLTAVPLLNVGCSYVLHYNKILKATVDVEISRVAPNQKLYEIQDPDAIFVIDNDTECSSSVLNAEQVMSVIANSNRMISFTGVIKSKSFSDPLASRSQRNTKIRGYGASGSKTEVLHFYADASRTETFTLYLNNWEHKQTSYGLLPNMRVLVYNVQPQKGKYLKSCALTLFKIISYEPPVQFQTVNLYTRDDSTGCGRCCYLGYNDLIPDNVLVWSPITTLEIVKLNLRWKCCLCDFEITEYGPCRKCDANEDSRELKCTAILNVNTLTGRSSVLCVTEDLLKVLFGFNDALWKAWCKSFLEVGEFQFNKYERGMNSTDLCYNGELMGFREAFTNFIDSVNKKAMCRLDMVCRKIEYFKSYAYKTRATWLCIQVRPGVYK